MASSFEQPVELTLADLDASSSKLPMPLLMSPLKLLYSYIAVDYLA